MKSWLVYLLNSIQVFEIVEVALSALCACVWEYLTILGLYFGSTSTHRSGVLCVVLKFSGLVRTLTVLVECNVLCRDHSWACNLISHLMLSLCYLLVWCQYTQAEMRNSQPHMPNKWMLLPSSSELVSNTKAGPYRRDNWSSFS